MAVALGNEQVQVHDLNAPPGVEPRVVRVGGRPLGVAIEPGGSWMAVQDNRTLSLWPLSWRHPQVLRHGAKSVRALAIDPGSRWIASGGEDTATVSLWPLPRGLGHRPDDPGCGRRLRSALKPRLEATCWRWVQHGAVDSAARRPSRATPGIQQHGDAVAFDRSGRWLAAGGGMLGQLLAAPGENVVRVWDLETRAVRVLAAADGAPIGSVAFLPDGRLLAAGPAGVRMWDLTSDTSTLLLPDIVAKVLPSPDGRRLLLFRARCAPAVRSGVRRSTTSTRSNRRRSSLTATR